MKATKWTAKTLASLLLIVGVAMVVVAAGALLSNVLTIQTHVHEAVMSQENVLTVGLGGTEHPDLPIGEGDVSKGVTYDTGIRTVSTGALVGVTFKFTIAKVGISVADVSVQYWEPASTSWIALTMTDAGETLTGYFGPAGGFDIPANYNVMTPFLVTFITMGDYTTSTWLETAA